MDFFESKKSIDSIDVSINQSSLQISTNMVPGVVGHGSGSRMRSSAANDFAVGQATPAVKM